MSVQITHVRFENDYRKTHESITAYAYKQDATGAVESKWKADMVKYLEAGTTAHVDSGASAVAVAVVNANPKYLRTHANNTWTDNLLSLPTF